MAKHKDDMSFSFSKKPKDPTPPPADETSAESTEIPADPFASTELPVDPFASSDAPAADPFASSETPADPFASTDTPADSFASTDAPATEESPTETPPEEPAPMPTDPAAPAGPAFKKPKEFRILILGDFSGRTNRNLASPADISSRKILNVDIDSLERIIAKLKPGLLLPVDDKSAIPLAFARLEDFRPDALLQSIEAFQGLLALRSELLDNKKFKDAAAKVRKLIGEKPAPKKPAAKSVAPATEGGGESDFERLMNQPIAPKNAGPIDTDALIANIVAGYAVPAADPDQKKLVTFVEDAISAGLRAILRHPAYQALESNWRGVEFLASRLNTDDNLKLHLLDISKDELFADLSGPGGADIKKTGLFQILVEQTRAPGAIPYSLVIGSYFFEQDPRDIALLAKLATLMHEAPVPFVAAATPRVAGFPSFSKFPDSGKWQPPSDIALWDKIRSHKLANFIALTAPRFLLRLPYGPKTDAIETYPFNEMPGAPIAEDYLWGNGAFAVAYGIAQGFLENGWNDLQPGLEIDDLPCHMAVVEGDKEMTPCAEAWLSERIGDILCQQLGLTPILSVRNSPSAHISGITSIAKGSKPLASAWT